MSYDWSVINAIIDLPIKMKGNSKCSSGNLIVESVGGQNEHVGAASQTLLTEVKLGLRHRLL